MVSNFGIYYACVLIVVTFGLLWFIAEKTDQRKRKKSTKKRTHARHHQAH